MRLGSSPVRLVLHRLPILKTRDRLASPLARLLHARHRGTHCYIQRTHSYSCYNPLSIHTNTLYGASSRVTALLMPHCPVLSASPSPAIGTNAHRAGADVRCTYSIRACPSGSRRRERTDLISVIGTCRFLTTYTVKARIAPGNCACDMVVQRRESHHDRTCTVFFISTE